MTRTTTFALMLATTFVLGLLAAPQLRADEDDAGVVRAANLIYADNMTSVCFSDEFLVQVQRDTYIKTERRFSSVKLASGELYEFPFAVMTGEGNFTLTEAQRDNLHDYLTTGGFLVASAGCSSRQWNESFEREIAALFPDFELTELEEDHPIFHMVYDVTEVQYRDGSRGLPRLKGLEIDGKTVMVWSPDGLNDSSNASPNCCCCGGNEIRTANEVNVNLLAYALLY